MEKISPADKLQALKHSKKYKEDYDQYLEEYKKIKGNGKLREMDRIYVIPGADRKLYKDSEPIDNRAGLFSYIELSEPGKKLCNKYKIDFPIHPDTPADGWDLIRVGRAVSYFVPRFFLEKLKDFPGKKIVQRELMAITKEQPVLIIDTAYPKDQIMDQLEIVLDIFCKKSSGRVKKTQGIDIWEVYREVSSRRKNCLQIAKALSGKKDNPAYDPDVERIYKKVKRAYSKASKLIHLVENIDQPK